MKSTLAIAALAVLGTTLQVQAATDCSTLSIAACEFDCDCRRVACCCGDSCNVNATSGEVLYNKCVSKAAEGFEWGCPGYADCPANRPPATQQYSECSLPPTPEPYGGQVITPGYEKTNIPFGTTFPMSGSQPVPKHTWQGNVFMGTNMVFNEGAYWGYTDSFFVPKLKYETPPDVETVENVQSSLPPTPEPDYSELVCYAYLQACPSGWYCKIAQGYHPEQKGLCAKTTGQAGGIEKWWQTKDANTSPGGNTFTNTQSIQDYFGSSAWFSNSAPSCKAPSVCGYKSLGGDCWCDNSCHATNDCCTDITTHCPTAPPTPPAYMPPLMVKKTGLMRQPRLGRRLYGSM